LRPVFSEFGFPALAFGDVERITSIAAEGEVCLLGVARASPERTGREIFHAPITVFQIANATIARPISVWIRFSRSVIVLCRLIIAKDPLVVSDDHVINR